MDNLDYMYYTFSGGFYNPAVNIPADATNKLAQVTDAAASGNYGTDIDHQTATNNYKYDESGQLTSDAGECIDNIEWMANGKVKKITRTTGCQLNGTYPADLEYQYNAMGQRTVKIVKPRDNSGNLKPQTDWIYTYYALDATGNVMATYERTFTNGTQANEYNDNFKLQEQYIYATKRAGVVNNEYLFSSPFTAGTQTVNGETVFDITIPPVAPNTNAIHDTNGDGISEYTRVLGEKQYELTDHQGNVTEVISDKHLPTESEGYVFEDYENQFIATAGTTHVPGTWFIAPGVTYTFEDDGFGNERLKIDETVQNNGAHRSFTVQPNTTYTLTFDAEYDAQNNTPTVRISERDGVTLLENVVYFDFMVTGSNSVVFTTSSNPNVNSIRVKLNGSPVPSGFYIDNFKVTGNGLKENIFTQYIADVTSYSDYLPGGMQKTDRFGSQQEYRYLYQGQEKEPEITGNNAYYSYEYRFHDSRLNRFVSIDPLADKYAYNSPYAFSENRLIDGVELEGLEFGATPSSVIWSSNIGMELSDLSDEEKAQVRRFLAQIDRKIGGGVILAEASAAVILGLIFAPEIVVAVAPRASIWLSNPANQFLAMETAGFFSGLLYDGPEDLCPQCKGDEFAKGLRRITSYVWDNIGQANRGKVLEGLASSFNYKGWNWVGRLDKGYFPSIDFIKDGLGVQLKTFNGKSVNFTDYKNTIDDLVRVKNAKKVVGKEASFEISDVRLDILLKSEDQKILFKKVENYAAEKGINIKFETEIK